MRNIRVRWPSQILGFFSDRGALLYKEYVKIRDYHIAAVSTKCLKAHIFIDSSH